MTRAKENRQDYLALTYDHLGSGNWVTPPVAATGTIQCATKANLVDTDYITISDGILPAVRYSMDTAGDGGTGVAVDLSGATDAASVAALLRTAILANQPGISVVNAGAGLLNLTLDVPGVYGNVTITENVVHASMTVSGFSGGADAVVNTEGDTTISLWKPKGRRFKVDRVSYINPTGLAEHSSNVFIVKLLKGSTVVASYSTDSDEAGADNSLVANTFTELTLSSTAADSVFNGTTDVMKLFLDEGGTASLPPGRIVVEGRLL